MQNSRLSQNFNGTLLSLLKNTNEKCKDLFSLPEFSPSKVIEWEMHVGTLENVHYDMIIRNDLLEHLKIDLKYSTSTIEWDGAEIPMRL